MKCKSFPESLRISLFPGSARFTSFSSLAAQEAYKDTSSQVISLRQMVKEKDEAIQRQTKLEKKIHELEKQGTIKIHKKGDGDISILPSSPVGTVVPAGNAAAVGVIHTGVAGGMPAPPPPPPLPVNGACRFDSSWKLRVLKLI